MAKKTITFQQAQISFDPNVNTTRGFFKDLDPDTGPPAARHAPTAADGNHLLHILFFLVYTQPGRAILDATRGPGKTDAQISASLKAQLQQVFGGNIDAAALDAIAKAHLAGNKYVAAFQANDEATMAQQSALYAEQVILLLGMLHDNAMAYEFSCAW